MTDLVQKALQKKRKERDLIKRWVRDMKILQRLARKGLEVRIIDATKSKYQVEGLDFSADTQKFADPDTKEVQYDSVQKFIREVNENAEYEKKR